MKVGAITLMTAFLLVLPLGAMAGNDPCVLQPLDSDSDGTCDVADGCSALANASPGNCDTDQDGYDNPCDADLDNNLSVNSTDFTAVWLPDFTGSGLPDTAGSDMDCNGVVNSTDFTATWLPLFTSGTLGPSGKACAGTVVCP